MDIKAKIEELVNKIKGNPTTLANFKSDPIKTVEGLLGVDLPDEQLKGIVDGVKAKIDLDSAKDKIGGILNIFKKK